jgi:hypothetical protein
MGWTDFSWSMCVSDTRFRRVARVIVIFVFMQLSVSVMAETADERIQRLENEVNELRQMLKEQKQTQDLKSTPSDTTTIPNREVVPVRPGAFVRYYISKERLGEQPPTSIEPIVQGQFTETHHLSFDPKDYDVPNSGMLSHYRVPSSYPNVGLLMNGDLDVKIAGEYELILHPKPAREGGTNVKTRMSAWLQVDGRTVVQFRDQSSWESQRGRVHLDPGWHRVQMWTVASSDGFGPSPTESSLQLAIKSPDDLSPHPLRDLQTREK